MAFACIKDLEHALLNSDETDHAAAHAEAVNRLKDKRNMLVGRYSKEVADELIKLAEMASRICAAGHPELSALITLNIDTVVASDGSPASMLSNILMFRDVAQNRGMAALGRRSKAKARARAKSKSKAG